jgi:hypothetical protein
VSLKDQKIEELQRELALTRVDFSTRLQRLEQKISALNQDKIPQSAEQSETIQAYQPPAIENQRLQPEAAPTITLAALTESESGDAVQSANATKSEARPSYLKLLFNSVLKELGILIFNLLSPLTKFTTPAINLYQHYQAKGQGPIFVFMLIGIALLVGGFGYLAQLLVGELGAGSKSLLLFLVAIVITLGGAYLAKHEKYSEISSAIVSLGLLLNFVTVYVAGSFYQLLPGWMVLLSYFAIACTGFILANKFDAKIVSALSVIGGGAIPLISLLDQQGTTFYLLGLAFIVLASLYQAHKKQWLWLGFISVFVAYSCIEFLLLTSSNNMILGLFSQGFYCAFLGYVGVRLAKQDNYSKDLLALIAIIVFANIGILYQGNFSNLWIMPALSLFNAMIGLVLLQTARRKRTYTVSLYTILASSWLLVAIVSSLAPDYWGFAVGLEGLFILYFGLKENYDSVRFEAYALLTFAVVHAIFAVFPYFPDPALLSLKGNLVVASIGIWLFCSRKLLTRFDANTNWEQQLTQFLRPLESMWLALFALSLFWVQLGEWAALAILPVQVVLLFKSYRHSCHTTEFMAYLTGIGIIVIAVIGINEVQSLSFRELPNYAKAALVLVFAECWLFAEFYRRIGQKGALAKLAEVLRLGFYLILPLVFLPSVIKHYLAFSALAIWLSASIAYVLGHWIRHKLIRTEALFLFTIAVIYNLSFYIDFYAHEALLTYLSSFLGLCLYAYFLYRAKGRHVALLDKKIATLGIYFIATCLAIYVNKLTNVYIAGAVLSSYFFVLAILHQKHPILVRNRQAMGYLCYLGVVVSWLGISLTGSHNIISGSVWVIVTLIISISFLIQANKLNQLTLKVFTDSKNGYSIQHLLLTIGVSFLLAAWDLALLISPLLILQGSYLFFTHKHSKFVAKLALGFIFVGLLKLGFVDAANALLWQKVALMIGIGLFMLGAAFVYQKRLVTENE